MTANNKIPVFESKFSGFHDLMKFRVREILLVSSLYDAFVLEEDGRLAERIFSEYLDLNLHFVPRITKVSSTEEAFSALQKASFDLIITTLRITDMNPIEFGKKIKESDPDKTIVLLTYEPLNPLLLKRIRQVRSIDKVFYWSGESKLLLAIIKYVEDMKNAPHDNLQGVQIILIAEDSPKYYSLYLPNVYTEIMTQTRKLIADGINTLHRLMKMRARPKILMAESFEEALEIVTAYEHNLLGVICDLKFPSKSHQETEVGFALAEIAKSKIPDLPILIQSADTSKRKEAEKRQATFLDKNSQNLLHDLRSFILQNFGFGDFVFRHPNGKEICRAKNLNEFAERVLEVPAESLEYHAQRNHISIWLRARTEFQLADKLRPKRVSDFPNIESIRQDLYESIQTVLVEYQHGVIKDFGVSKFYTDSSFIRLGSGSLGGKGRGIAFINAMLANDTLLEKYQNIEIKTPQSFVIGTEVFEEFMEENNLEEFAIQTKNENKILEKFIDSNLSPRIVKQLETLLDEIEFPLTIRSSSLLEDSLLLPFAGLYKTVMIPNTHSDIRVRLKHLLTAIKFIYASVYFKEPKEYVKNTDYRIEEEKMAIIIQQCVGIKYGEYFYPVISGVAQSFNYYPTHPVKSEDGLVHLSLGLGKTIMEGERVYRFSPKHPQTNLPYASAEEVWQNSQTNFFALKLSNHWSNYSIDENQFLIKLDISQAESDGALFFVGSTYSPQDKSIQHTLSLQGPRVITFANVLKYKIFPLSEIITEFLNLGYQALGTHVEVEFAINLYKDKYRKPEFYILQIRPMVTGGESLDVLVEGSDLDKAICFTHHAIGNGVMDNIYDLIFVDPDELDFARSSQIALEVEELNHQFIKKDNKYILVGFGRWGTADPWLGIPVDWYQVSRAQIIIESCREDLNTEPSQGSHFFHNLISLRLGYFYIKGAPHADYIDWKWLKSQKPFQKTKHLRHLRLKKPFITKIDGRTSTGVIFKPT